MTLNQMFLILNDLTYNKLSFFKKYFLFLCSISIIISVLFFFKNCHIKGRYDTSLNDISQTEQQSD